MGGNRYFMTPGNQIELENRNQEQDGFFHRLLSDRIVLTIIVIDAIAIIWGLESSETLARILRWIDFGCVLFFVAEAGIKIRLLGWKHYWSSGWCRFDFLVVLLSTPVLLEPVMSIGGDFMALSAIRIGRLFRLFRALRFIPNYQHLIAGVRRALEASVGVFLALALMNTILSVSAYVLFHSIDQENFGSPIRATYSMYKVFTIEGWYEMPDSIAAAAEESGASPAWGHIAQVFFMIAVLIGGILGVSIANAVFVDEMVYDNNKDLESKIDNLSNQIAHLSTLLEDQSSNPKSTGQP